MRRDVGVFTARGGSIGWLAAKDGLVVVDTQFADTAALCLAGLPGRGQRQLDAVINTHHHGDHVGGNLVLKPAAKTIVAHANVPALQRAAAERAGNVDKQAFANETFADSWRQEIGSEVMGAKYHGPGHTKGDVLVHFERANVVHMGDLMFNRVYPVMDRPGGASVLGWVKILEKVAKDYPADAIYIFGHGNPKFGVTGQRSDVLILRDYFTALIEHVTKAMAAGQTKEQVSAMDNLPGFPDFHVTPPATGPAQVSRLRGNLGVVFDELSEKKA